MPTLLLVRDNPWLEPFRGHIRWWHCDFLAAKKRIEEIAGFINACTLAYQEFGLHHVTELHGITYKEWAPNAQQFFLVGDFNGWNFSDPR
jgi:1,4-alpha-glucan branching enzyme